MARSVSRPVLILGDALAYLVVVLAGFVTHREIEALPHRLWATYLPFLAAWLSAAGAIGALDPHRAADPRQLWRVAAAALLAAPLAAVLRGALLGTLVVPLFVAVMAGVSLLAVLGWRLLALLAARRGP